MCQVFTKMLYRNPPLDGVRDQYLFDLHHQYFKHPTEPVTLTPVSTTVLVQNQVSRVHIFILKSHEFSNLPSVKPQCFVSSYLD